MKDEELQRAADRNDMKGFYSRFKEVWGPQTKQPVHLESSDGLEIFTDSKSMMARWSEYFQKLLNVPGDIELEVLENIQKRCVNTALDEKPTVDEMVRAIKGLKDGKAPGGDGIPAEVWKYGVANLSNRLHRWIIKVWEEGHVPQARIILCSDHTEQTLRSNYPRGGARDTMRLSLKQKHSRHDLLPTTTPGKCIEQDRPLYIVFVDFTKAFDTVGRTGLWQLLRKYGYPKKFKA